MAERLTTDEIWARQQGFDFEVLMEPYRDGGSEHSPVRQTMGTIVDYLLYKKKYPVDIIGAAILKTFLELQAGKEFPGDGSYASKTRELIIYIRTQCDVFEHKQLTDRTYEWITKNILTSVTKWAAKETKRKTRPWFVRIFIRRPFIEVKELPSEDSSDNS